MKCDARAPRACLTLRCIVLVFLCSVFAIASELPAACKAPAGFDAKIDAGASASAYDALGAWFAGHSQLECALAAFQAAVNAEPHSAEAHYDYGVALAQIEKLPQAAEQFRLALKASPNLQPAHAALGSVLLDEGKAAEAEPEFREVLQTDLKSVVALDHLAQALSSERRYDAAIRYWTEALTVQPDSAEIKLSIATSMYEDAVAKQQMGVPGAHDTGTREAIRQLSELIQSNPGMKSAHFTLGNIFAREARFREAADEYAAAVKLDPEDNEALLAEVKALDTVSAYQEALAPAREYVDKKVSDPEGHLLLGAVYRGLGEYAKAQPELAHAVAGNPQDFQSQYQLGFVLARLDKPQEALSHLKKAVQLKPDDSSAQFQLSAVLRTLGDTAHAAEIAEGFKKAKEQEFKVSQLAAQGNKANQYLESGHPDQAADVYRQMLELEPRNAHTEYNLALALEAAHDATGAEKALRNAAELDPTMALARAELGRIYLERAEMASAKKLLEEAVALDPQLVSALGNLGVIYAQEGQMAKAQAVLRQALEDDADYAQGHLNLGLILAQQQRYADAEPELRRALALAPKDPRTMSALGKVECRLGKSQDGIDLLERVAASDPNSAAAHLDLAIAKADGYDMVQALAEAEIAVRLAPDAAATHFNRGALLFDLGRPTEARPDFEAAIRLAPNMPQPHYYLALVAKQAGEYAAAVDHLQIVVKQDSRNAMAWQLLGQCLDAESKHDEAIRAWRHALSITPNSSQVLWNLGRALKASDPQESARLLKQFDEIQKTNKVLDRANTLNNDAVLAMQQGDWAAAEQKLEEALQMCANCTADRDLHKNLGLVYCHAGQIDRGEKELRLADASKPGDPDVQRALTLIAQTRSRQAQSAQQVH